MAAGVRSFGGADRWCACFASDCDDEVLYRTVVLCPSSRGYFFQGGESSFVVACR